MTSVKQHIARAPAGVPFTTRSLLHLGSRAAVDEALYRLAKEDYILRIERGLYVRQRVSELIGKVSPSAEAIAKVVAASTNSRLDIAGAAAANMLGLSTQMPTQSVFITDGPTRRIRFGKMRLTLRHVSARKLAFAGTPAGRGLSALLYLGRKVVDDTHVIQVRRSIGEAEFNKLVSAASILPAWLTAVLRSHNTKVRHV